MGPGGGGERGASWWTGRAAGAAGSLAAQADDLTEEDDRSEEAEATETVEAVDRADDATLQLSHACAQLPATARVRRSRLATFSSDTARTSMAYCGMPPLDAIAARRDDALMLFNHFSTSSSHPSTISYSMVS